MLVVHNKIERNSNKGFMKQIFLIIIIVLAKIIIHTIITINYNITIYNIYNILAYNIYKA